MQHSFQHESSMTIPWLEVDGGYRYIAEQDDSSWAVMMQPGASGYGLLVAHMEPRHDGQYVDQIYDPYGVWLFPAVVQWHSIFDSDGGIAQFVLRDVHNILDEYGDIEGPLVALWGDSVWTAGELYEEYGESPQVSNVSYDRRYLEEGKALNIITGYVSVMKIVPITEQAFYEIGSSIHRANQEFGLSALSVGGGARASLIESLEYSLREADIDRMYSLDGRDCHCPIELGDEYHYVDCKSLSCGPTPHEHEVISYVGFINCDRESCQCSWDYVNKTCLCGSTEPTLIQQVEVLTYAIGDGELTVKGDILSPQYHQLWDYCIERYLKSLLWFANNHLTTPDSEDWNQEWFTSSWRLLSPYSDTRTLSTHLQRLSERSTDSVRLLAS
jgi:hypothetical protein